MCRWGARISRCPAGLKLRSGPPWRPPSHWWYDRQSLVVASWRWKMSGSSTLHRTRLFTRWETAEGGRPLRRCGTRQCG
eukprot:2008910-Prymnesium_polylepis.1